MANYVSKITGTNGTTYDVREIYPHVGTCSDAAATAAKTVTIGNFKLYTGAWVVVKFTNTNSAAVASLTLNIDGTGAKPIKYRNANLSSVGQLVANRYTMFIYDGTNYQFVGDINTNDNTYDRNRYNANIKAGSSALVAANIIVGKDGVYTHLKSGAAFDVSYPILYNAGGVDAGATTTNTYDIIHFTVTTTQSITLTAYKPVYIKGTLSGTIFTPIGTAPLTQTIPTSADSYHYIYLGTATGTTTIYLQEYHPIYAYMNGAFAPTTVNATYAGTASKLGTANKGSATNPIYLAAGTPTACTYSLGSTVNAGTAKKVAYYSGANAISPTSFMAYDEIDSAASTPVTRKILHIYGPGVGNDATSLISGTTGIISYGDGGPQINFNTASSLTIGGGQDGALIFTDHDSAAAGVSWHFVSNQPDWNVISKRFHAKTSISIGTDLPNTSYGLYVNGTTNITGATTIGGLLTTQANQYGDDYNSGAINMQNSNLCGVNAIYTADAADNAAEGIHFYRDSTHVDTLWMSGGALLFVPNRELGSNTSVANSQKVARFTANPTSGQVVITDGTYGGVKSSGYTIATSVPSGAVFTDTKVTSSANHYTPATASGSDKTASASGATAAWGIDVVKGITINTDGKGHITGLSVTSGKIPGNPDTDTKVTQSSTTTTDYRPITLGYKNSTSVSDLDATVTNQVYTSQNFFVKPSTGVMFATEFMTKSYLTGTGADLGQYGLYLKSYLKRADNTEALYSDYVIRTYNGKISSNDGLLVTVGGGGLTILGGGESATALAGLISDDTTASGATTLNVGGTLNTTLYGNNERAIISSDDAIYFITNCQTIANRKPVCLDNNLYFYPGTNDTGSLGTSSYRWNTVYANVIYGVDHKTVGTSHGYYLKDQSGTEYGGVYDNGSNLWIGSTMSSNRHHKGQTYISTGWTGTLPTTSGGTLTGNSTIFISVPKYTATSATAGTWDHTAYFALHSGNFTTTGSGNAVTSVTFDSSTQKLTFTKGSTFLTSLPSHTHAYTVPQSITIQTGSTKQAHITLQTLMTWLITTKGYITSNAERSLILAVSWQYSDNDILQLSIDGTNYELQLAGVIIEFHGKATDYQSGRFRLRIHSSPTTSFTANSGYTKFPVSHIAEYTCNGSSYSPTWKMLIDIADISDGTSTTGNGTISVAGKAVSVYGLGSAAYTASTSYLPSTTKYAASDSVAGPANLLAYRHQNEINFSGGKKTTCYFNYRDADTDAQDDGETPISIDYRFCDYRNSTAYTTITAANFAGNASTATKWQTARTLTIGSTGKSVDGSGNVSWSLSEIGAAAASHTHDSLEMKTLTASTIDTTAGTYGFKGIGLLGNSNADWAGFQVDASNDRFQLIANSQLLFRQNDESTMAGNWSAWVGCITPNNVSATSGIKVTKTTSSVGTGDGSLTYYSGVKIEHDVSTSADTTNTGTLSHGGTFTAITSVTRDSYGHVKTLNTKTYTLPGSGDTDTKVTQTAVGSTYTNYRPLVISASNADSAPPTATTVTDGTFITSSIYCQPSSGNVYATKFIGPLQGNADTATKWKTARTLTIGSTGKSVDGSGNVSWSLSEIGAASSSHSHDSLYAVASSGSVPSTTLSAGQFKVFYNVNQGLANNMPASNNANAIIQFNRHNGNYDSQLGFSSNGNLYYRYFNNETIGSQSWKTILDSGNLEAEAKHLDSYSAPVYTSIPINPIAYPLSGFHRSNKLAFMPAANITIEYSSDGGSTWVNYGASDDVKRDLFINKRGTAVNIGPSSGNRTTSMLTRIIVECDGRDAVLDRFLIQLDSSYHKIAVDVYVASASATTTYTKVATGNAIGTWGYEYLINLKHNSGSYYRFSNSNYKKIAFYLRYTTIDDSQKAKSSTISGIMGFTGSYWGNDCKNNLANLDHLYTWDRDQNATFPANVTATKFTGPLNVSRVSKDSKAFPGANKAIIEEYAGGANYNLPSSQYYHIISIQGPDTKYGTQLALGMTVSGAYYRNYNNQTWSDWKSLINTNTTYTLGTSGNNVTLTPAGSSAQSITVPYATSAGELYTHYDAGTYGTYALWWGVTTTSEDNTSNYARRNGNAIIKFRSDTAGWAEIYLGNTLTTGTEGSSTGWLGLYSPGTGCHNLSGLATDTELYHYLPATGGTILNTATGLQLSGGSMTGTINTPVNEVAFDFRNYDNWHTCVSYQTGGDEAFVLAAQNARTSIMFVSSENSIANHTNTRWQSLTPALQIKNNCVSIGKLIPQGTTPTIPLEVSSKIVISTATSGSPELQFVRGTTSDNYYDWRLKDSGGDFYFDVCTGSDTWTSRAWFPYGSNNFTILGSMSLKNGSYTATVQPSTMTANRTIVLPDKSGGLPVSNILYENSTGTQAPVVAEAKGYKYFIVTVYHGALGEQTAIITPNQTITDHCYFSWTRIDDSQAASLRVAGAHIKVEPASSTNSITFTVYISDRHILAPGNSSTISSTATSGTPVIRKIIGFM